MLPLPVNSIFSSANSPKQSLNRCRTLSRPTPPPAGVFRESAVINPPPSSLTSIDRLVRPPLFDGLQRLQNKLREDEHLALAEERMLPDEESFIQSIIDELAAFTREAACRGHRRSGSATPRRSGWCAASSPCCRACRRGCDTACSPSRRPIRPGSASPARGRTHHRTWQDYGQCSVAIKVMGVEGPKSGRRRERHPGSDPRLAGELRDPEQSRRSAAERWVRAKAPLGYLLNQPGRHLLHLAMQLLYSPMHTSPDTAAGADDTGGFPLLKCLS